MGGGGVCVFVDEWMDGCCVIGIGGLVDGGRDGCGVHREV